MGNTSEEGEAKTMMLDKRDFKLPANYTLLNNRQRRAVREQYVRKQEGNCWWCHKLLTIEPSKVKKVDPKRFPLGFFNNPVHLHHDHETRMTEGAVHAYCNAVMWQYHGR